MAGKVKEKKKRGTNGNKIMTPALQKVATHRMSITTTTAAFMADGGSTDGSSNDNCNSSEMQNRK